MRIILATLLICFSFQATASTPATKAKNIQWVWDQVFPFLKACLLSDACPLSATEDKILRQIVKQESSYNSKTIVFLSEAEHPETFQTGSEAHRLMATGLQPGPIYLNSDRFLAANADHPQEMIFGLFVHELVHHLGYKDDQQRIPDQVGSKLATLFKQALIPLDLEIPSVQAYVFNFPSLIQETAAQVFPQGLHPKLIFMSDGGFSTQSFDKFKDMEKNVCGVGNKLWGSTAAPSYVTTEAGTGVHMIEVRLMARCYEPAKNVLQEVAYYAVSRVTFDNQGQVATGEYHFSKTAELNPSSSYLQVQNLQHSLKIVAGQTWTGEAELISPQLLDGVEGCSGVVTSEKWGGPRPTQPLTVEMTRCRVLSMEGKKFRIQFQLDIPAGAPDKLEFQIMVLALQRKSGFLVGRPGAEQKVQIQGGSPLPVSILSLEFQGSQKIPNTVNSFYVPRGQTVAVKWKYSRPVDWIDAYVNFQAQDIHRELMPGSFSSRNDWHLDPLMAPGREMVAMMPLQFVGLDKNWNFVFQDLQDLKYMLSWVVPK